MKRDCRRAHPQAIGRRTSEIKARMTPSLEETKSENMAEPEKIQPNTGLETGRPTAAGTAQTKARVRLPSKKCLFADSARDAWETQRLIQSRNHNRSPKFTLILVKRMDRLCQNEPLKSQLSRASK